MKKYKLFKLVWDNDSDSFQGWYIDSEHDDFESAEKRIIEVCGEDYASEPNDLLNLPRGFFSRKNFGRWELMLEIINQ